MKTNKIISAFLLVLFLAPSAFAQEEENQLVYTLKHKVKPEKIEEYNDLMKKFASACKEFNYPFTIYTYQSSLPDFYYFYPVKDYNAKKEVIDEAWKIVPNMEQDWGSKFIETLESWDDFFIRKIDTLCYKPETSVDGLVYAEMWISYNKPGTGMKYRNAYKRAVEMQKKVKTEYRVDTFQADTGMSGPAYIIVFRGKNPADLYTHFEKDWENLGEEVQEMLNDLRSTTRKFEKIPFWSLKELSYSPE